MGKPNKLIKEKSPYLLQHAHNPVDWYPWGPEAFNKAKKENKPVFLSIGYSSCHWCHRMEKESFEDKEVAELLNKAFVCIKVDREERPDIDNVYIAFCRALTGSAGWPLTVLLTPDKNPFFAGTYFSKSHLLELIPKIKELWEKNPKDIEKLTVQVSAALQEEPAEVGELNRVILTLAYEELEKMFDPVNGGFGGAPKFPTPSILLFLLRYWKRTGKSKALEMVEKTLQAMRLGGIWDHIGFGFHRYSTDPYWLVPHFEKMLYDQALLAIVYTEAFQATGKVFYRQTAEQIFSYSLNNLLSPEGAFYSSEDADSEGEEGKFYIWSAEEFKAPPGKDSEKAMKLLNIEPTGNFIDPSTREFTGKNIPHLSHLLSKKEMEFLEEIRKKLFYAREKKIHPAKDDKILTDWNSLMIAALSKASQAFENPAYSKAAARAADFILNNLVTKEGKLLHRYRDKEAAIPANLDDYSFFVFALLELYEATFETKYLSTALKFSKLFLQHFQDPNGGFFFTADDSEQLPIRIKEAFDGALPSGNSVAALNLLRLSRITGDQLLEKKSLETAKAFSGQLLLSPASFTFLLSALNFSFGPSYEIVLSGNTNSPDTKAMLKTLHSLYIPNKVLLLSTPELSKIAPFAANQNPIEGKATAYICERGVCSLPTTSPKALLQLLGS